MMASTGIAEVYYRQVGELSKGYKQRVGLAQAILHRPDLLILDEPTRGIDVGAKAEIYQLMSELAKEGVAQILISSDLPEVLGMSDRIVVMAEGRVTATFDQEEATPEKVMQYASIAVNGTKDNTSG